MNPIAPPGRQRGMTTIGIILVLATIGFFATIVIKLTPVYLESFQLDSIFKSLQKDEPLASTSDEQIRSSLDKRFDINNINDIKVKDVVIERKRGRVTALRLQYETRVPMFGNIDAVVHFNKVFEVSR